MVVTKSKDKVYEKAIVENCAKTLTIPAHMVQYCIKISYVWYVKKELNHEKISIAFVCLAVLLLVCMGIHAVTSDNTIEAQVVARDIA